MDHIPEPHGLGGKDDDDDEDEAMLGLLWQVWGQDGGKCGRELWRGAARTGEQV